MNKGDVEAALALMTDDVKLMNGAMLVSAGKNEARTELDEPPGQETKYLVKDCQPAGDRVECTLSMADACITASGLSDGLPVRMEFIFQNGKIGQWSILSEGGEMAAFALWQQKMRTWAKANRPEEWAKYIEYGDTKEGDAAWFKLCQEYAESLKAAPTPAADLVAPVKAWADALNKGDVEAALAPMADNVWWKASYQFSEMGKEVLRGMFAYLVAMETKHQIKECRQQADRVTCTVSVADGCIAAFGALDGLPAELEFKFGSDGKISDSSMTAHDPRWKDRGNFMGAVTAWAAANRPEDWANALDDDWSIGGAASAKVCKEYAESQK